MCQARDNLEKYKITSPAKEDRKWVSQRIKDINSISNESDGDESVLVHQTDDKVSIYVCTSIF